MAAYYNEHDPFAAAWLRELITDGLIAPGEVDERSIEDVTPDELRPFRQCHFFAGIGVWSLAARLAGIPDDAPLWSGSCPCQPFSAAGKGGGFDDERHLWPAFFHLIEQRNPKIVVGEQVAGRDGDAWLDLVQDDVEATAYAFGAAETVACGFGAPHKRSRNYWLAHRIGEELEGLSGHGDDRDQPGRVGADTARPVAAGGNADELGEPHHQRHEWTGRAWCRGYGLPNDGAAISMAYDDIDRRAAPSIQRLFDNEYHAEPRLGIGGNSGTGPVNGFWRDADWLRCRDEKWRPVEPGTFPLVDAGTFRNRVGLLRGAGNAITVGQAKGFLDAVVGSIGRWW